MRRSKSIIHSQQQAETVPVAESIFDEHGDEFRSRHIVSVRACVLLHATSNTPAPLPLMMQLRYAGSFNSVRTCPKRPTSP